MAFTEGSQTGTTSNTTSVVIVSAPSASTRRLVKNITIYNADTVAANVFIQCNDNSSIRRITKQQLLAGETLAYTDLLVLDATTKRIEAVLGANVTTSQLDFTSHYGDAS